MICKEEINELLPSQKQKQQNTTHRMTSAIRKNICMTKHLLPWVPAAFLSCDEELSPEISYDFLKLSISYFTPYVRLIFVEKGNLKFWDSKM